MCVSGLFTKAIPVTTEEYGLSKAARPFNSRLDRSKLVETGFEPLRQQISERSTAIRSE